MGEALISRSGGGEAEAILPVVPGICTLLVSVKDSLNRPAANIMVNCKDGNSWYNYTTNDKGQVMFSTNSGSANISVFNRFSNGIWILDQKSNILNIDAPVSTSNKINVIFEGYTKNYELNFTKSSSGNNAPTPPIFPTGNYAFLISNQINVFVGGGGAGGSVSVLTGIGGGAGGANLATININKGQLYYGYLASGGVGASKSWDYSGTVNGGSGGTTTFAGISAGGGSFNKYGSGIYVTGNSGNSSSLSNFGGGGQNSSHLSDSTSTIGSPGGGIGGHSYKVDDKIYWSPMNGGNGQDGLGGGGGAGVYRYGYQYSGGKGGNGTIRIKFID